MPKFNLKIEEHQDFGGLGISFSNGRDYFEPALTGLQVAHDILEHTVTPHPNGYIDEFMAIGAVLAGRVENGYINEYGRIISVKDIQSDVYSLAIDALNTEYSLCPKSCSNYLKDSDLMSEIRTFVRKGLLEAVNEYEDVEYNYLQMKSKYNFDVDSIVGWICKGYQLFKKRFPDTNGTSIHLFNKISKVCDDWLKYAEEGYEAELYINFTTFDVKLSGDW